MIARAGGGGDVKGGRPRGKGGGDVIGGRSGDELQENVEIASFLTLHNSLAIAARGTFLNT